MTNKLVCQGQELNPGPLGGLQEIWQLILKATTLSTKLAHWLYLHFGNNLHSSMLAWQVRGCVIINDLRWLCNSSVASPICQEGQSEITFLIFPLFPGFSLFFLISPSFFSFWQIFLLSRLCSPWPPLLCNHTILLPSGTDSQQLRVRLNQIHIG